MGRDLARQTSAGGGGFHDAVNGAGVKITTALGEEHSVRFASSTIWRFLDRHDMTVRKTAHASEQTRPDDG